MTTVLTWHGRFVDSFGIQNSSVTLMKEIPLTKWSLISRGNINYYLQLKTGMAPKQRRDFLERLQRAPRLLRTAHNGFPGWIPLSISDTRKSILIDNKITNFYQPYHILPKFISLHAEPPNKRAIILTWQYIITKKKFSYLINTTCRSSSDC